MSALTQLVLPTMGKLRANPAPGESAASITLPQSWKHDSLPLMDALARRGSSCGITRDTMPLRLLSRLLWATDGMNRADGGRTVPSAVNVRKIDLFVAFPVGANRYQAGVNALRLVASGDLGRVTRNQDFVDETPCTQSFVEACAPLRRMRIVMGGFLNEMP